MERSPEFGGSKREAPRVAGYAGEEDGGLGACHGGIARVIETFHENRTEYVVRETAEREVGAFQRREGFNQRRPLSLEGGDLPIEYTDSVFVLCDETGECLMIFV